MLEWGQPETFARDAAHGRSRGQAGHGSLRRAAPGRASLRSQAIILPDVAADLAGSDQPVCYLLLHVPKADLFALQSTTKPVKGG